MPPIKLIRSKRKPMCIEVTSDCQVIVRAPLRISEKEINRFIGEKADWIEKSRWGSCSGKGNLNFNCLLINAPDEIIDYVVVHELCHRKEMDHSPRFWAHVEAILPDYKERRKWLKDHGNELMKKEDSRTA